MRCCLLAVGSRGDVAPFLAIGRELASDGHEVHVVVLRDYAHLAAGSGLVVHPAAADSVEAMWPRHRWLRRASLAQPGIMYAVMRRSLTRSAEPLAAAVLDAARGCDVLVTGTAGRGAALRLGAACRVPVVTVLMAPLLPAARSEQSVLVPAWAGPLVGRVVSRLLWRMTRGLGGGVGEAVACRLGDDAPSAAAREVMVCATSATLAPGVVQAGWIDGAAASGATTRPAWGLDAGLTGFLDDHPDAVVMGFGSCPSVDPWADVALFRAAAARCGRPLVLQTSLLPAGRVDERTWNAPGADHRLLLPRAAGVVHHGGAGTTITALAAGVPAVVVPHLGDQAWHARRVAALGAGVAGPPRWRLTSRALARCLQRALTPGMARRASELAAVVAAEAGGAWQVADLVAVAAG